MGRLAVIVGCVAPVIAGSAASSAGCAQIAGIGDTSDKGRAGNSLDVVRMSIGATVTTAPLNLTGLRASYLVENATASGFERVPAMDAGGGKWVSTLTEATPVEFTLPDVPTPVPRMFAFPHRALSILYSVLEHPGSAPAPEGATVALMVDLDRAYVAADRFQVYTVGSWTSRALLATEILQPPDMGLVQISTLQPYAFASSSNVAGRPQLDKLTLDDVFLILRYTGAALTGVAVPQPFDQTGSDTVTATGPRAMVAVPQDQMLDVKFETMVTARFGSVRPAVTGLAMSWNLVAAPGYKIASNAGPVLQSGSLTPAELGLVVAYGNPFVAREWRTIFTLATTASRVYTPPGSMTPVTLFAGMNEFIEPSPGYVVKLGASLATLINFGERQLLNDGQMVPKPTRLVPVTFIPENPINTLYNLQVYDLVANMAGNALEMRLVFAAASNEPRFDVPPDVFVLGHSYTLRAISTVGGYPTIDTGDFLNRTLPLSQSFVDSGVFTVMP